MNPGVVFVRGVWRIIPSEDDTSWIEKVAREPADDSPCGDYGSLVRKMLNAGLSPEEIARFARIVGYYVAFGMCYHLGDPNASYEDFDDDTPEIEWDLYEVENDKPTTLISCVHEHLLMADPSGREMRPKNAT